MPAARKRRCARERACRSDVCRIMSEAEKHVACHPRCRLGAASNLEFLRSRGCHPQRDASATVTILALYVTSPCNIWSSREDRRLREAGSRGLGAGPRSGVEAAAPRRRAGADQPVRPPRRARGDASQGRARRNRHGALDGSAAGGGRAAALRRRRAWRRTPESPTRAGAPGPRASSGLSRTWWVS